MTQVHRWTTYNSSFPYKSSLFQSCTSYKTQLWLIIPGGTSYKTQLWAKFQIDKRIDKAKGEKKNGWKKAAQWMRERTSCFPGQHCSNMDAKIAWEYRSLPSNLSSYSYSLLFFFLCLQKTQRYRTETRYLSLKTDEYGDKMSIYFYFPQSYSTSPCNQLSRSYGYPLS